MFNKIMKFINKSIEVVKDVVNFAKEALTNALKELVDAIKVSVEGMIKLPIICYKYYVKKEFIDLPTKYDTIMSLSVLSFSMFYFILYGYNLKVSFISSVVMLFLTRVVQYFKNKNLVIEL